MRKILIDMRNITWDTFGMANAVFLELKNITKAFPGVLALDKVSFSARLGEVHALCGENGAGKSTLMKIINGIYKADAGEILI